MDPVTRFLVQTEYVAKQICSNAHLKHLMAVMLLTRLAMKAAVVVREVTSMLTSACLRVALTRLSSLALLEPEPPVSRNSPCFCDQNLMKHCV